jgi:hypothetical protein
MTLWTRYLKQATGNGGLLWLDLLVLFCCESLVLSLAKKETEEEKEKKRSYPVSIMLMH